MVFEYIISHIEIPAPDLDKAAEFYYKVFNWKKVDAKMENYVMFKIGETGTGGAFDNSIKPAPEKAGPQLVIEVEDIEKKLKQIEVEGGKIVQNKTEIPGGHGYYAVFQDPNNNYMQIHSMA